MAHAIKALLSYYDAAYLKRFGVKAPIVGAKDAALAKRLLATYTQEQLEGWLDRFFESTDQFIQQSGYTFGVFKACLGKVIKQDWQQFHAPPAVTRAIEALDDDIRIARRRDELLRQGKSRAEVSAILEQESV